MIEMRKQHHRGARRGFTLIELLAVMGIMLLIMGVIVSSTFSIGRGQRLRSGVETLRNSLALARQYAITQSAEVTVDFHAPDPEQSEDTHFFTITAQNVFDNSDPYVIRTPTYLPNGVKMKFDVERQDDLDENSPELTFKPNGKVEWTGSSEPKLWLFETRQDSDDLVLVEIYALTGVIYVEWIDTQ